MPIPKPKVGQSQDDFTDSCMSNEVMKKEFPKTDQRYAVCMQSWRDSKGEKKSFISTPVPILRSFEQDGKRYLGGYIGFWEVPDDFGTVLTPEIVKSSWDRLRKFPAVRFMHKIPFGQLVFDEEIKGYSTKTDDFGFMVLVRAYDEASKEWGMVEAGGWGFSYGLFPAPNGIQRKCFASGKCFDAFVKGVIYEVSVVDTPAHIDAVAHVLRSLNSNHTGETVLQNQKEEKNLEKKEIEQMFKDSEQRMTTLIDEKLGQKQATTSIEEGLKGLEQRLIKYVDDKVGAVVPPEPTKVEKTFTDANAILSKMDEKIKTLRGIETQLKVSGEDVSTLTQRITQLESERTKFAESITATVETVVQKNMDRFSKRLSAIENAPDFHSPATNTGQPVQRTGGFLAQLTAAYGVTE